MSSNHGQTKRDYIGGTLNIAGKEIVDRRANVCGNNGKFKGDVQVKGDLTIGGDILGSTEPIHITQQKMDDAGGNLVLSESGPYSFVEDITGVITVDAECVCINLNCYELDVGGAPIGIIISGFDHVTVCNGCIVNALTTAVSVANADGVKLCGLKFDGANSNEQAILLVNCTNLEVKGCLMRGFLSTNSAVVQFDSCDGMDVCDVCVTECTKTLAAPSGGFPAGFFNVASRLVSLNSCSNFNLTQIRVNNNTSNSVQATNTFEAIGIGSSGNGVLNKCETNNNTIINGGNPGVFVTLMIDCQRIMVKDSQCNQNSCEGPNNFFFGAGALFSSNIIIDGCQANNNFVSDLSVITGLIAGVWGMGCTLGKNNVIRNSQSCNNRIDNPNVRPSWEEVGLLEGFILDENGVFDQCQALYNSMGTTNAFTAVIGLNQEGAIGIESNCGTISNSNLSDNTGGEVAIGLLINTTIFGQALFPSNVNIINCTMNSNESYGFLVGFPPVNPKAGTVKGVRMIDCVLNNNGRSSSGDTAGIYFLQSVDGDTDIIIAGCSINNTFSDAGNAVGINILGASNVTIKDTTVNSTTADSVGHGILLVDCLDSKIMGCELDKNKNSGVELTGNVTNVAIEQCIAIDNDIGFNFDSVVDLGCLVKDCQALTNATAGFNYQPAVIGTSFIGNKGQNNGVDFQFPSVALNLQRLTNSTATYTQITGAGAALGSPLANLEIVP